MVNPLPGGGGAGRKYKSLECPVCRVPCKVLDGDVASLPIVYAMLLG